VKSCRQASRAVIVVAVVLALVAASCSSKPPNANTATPIHHLVVIFPPYAKPNFGDHTQSDQTSILRFIEDNWGTGRIGDDSFDAPVCWTTCSTSPVPPSRLWCSTRDR